MLPHMLGLRITCLIETNSCILKSRLYSSSNHLWCTSRLLIKDPVIYIVYEWIGTGLNQVKSHLFCRRLYHLPIRQEYHRSNYHKQILNVNKLTFESDKTQNIFNCRKKNTLDFANYKSHPPNHKHI